MVNGFWLIGVSIRLWPNGAKAHAISTQFIERIPFYPASGERIIQQRLGVKRVAMFIRELGHSKRKQ
jgi:hypothetical protein